MSSLPSEFARFPDSWEVVPFTQAVKDATSGNIKIAKQDYLESGSYPIVDQGQNFYGGFTDEQSALCKSELPTIIFGDHTRAFKFIDEPFVIGADGAKVLEPKTKKLDKKFLFYYLKQLRIESAGYSRHFKFLKETYVPLPPLAEQKRIAAILDKADAIRQKRQQAIKQADEFLRSVFLEMFGDPVTNPKGWGWSSVGEYIEYIGDIGSNGSNAVVAKNLDMLDSEDFALMVRTVNLNANDFSSNAKYISKETYDYFKKSKIYGGEIIMNKIGSAGQFWIMPNLNRPVSLGLNQFVIRLKNINTNFIYYYLSTEFGQAKIAASLRGAVTKSITKTAVKELPIYTPTLALQEKFSDVVSATQSTRKKLNSKDADSLFESLSQKAFSGQL